MLWGQIMLKRKLTRAGVRKGLIACCLYYSCLSHKCPRTPLEICKDFHMKDTKQFNKGDKEFRETFETSSKGGLIYYRRLVIQKNSLLDFVQFWI